MPTTEQRIAVWRATRAAAHKIGAPPSLRLSRGEMRCAERRWATTLIDVADFDCLDVAQCMLESGYKPVVLNLSDDEIAGGCVDLGSGAQEESLWRRTALSATQHQGFYPLCVEAGEPSVIYSPAVSVLRDTEERGYEWLPEPWLVSFIACPAIKYPEWIATDDEPGGDLCLDDKRELAERLRMILDTAASFGHDAVVLGPMGCGAWKNPPGAVARVFRSVLAEYQGCFRAVVVAALTTRAVRLGHPTTAEIFRSQLADLMAV